MGLKIRSIDFRDFRSYERFSLDEIGELTIFIGRNAIGKTNILEGIQLVTAATSFRHPQVSQVIRDGMPSGRVSMRSSDGNRDMLTELHLETGKRKYTVNGKAKGISDVRGILPAVVFSPDDLNLAKGSSSVKRSAFDEVGVQLSRNYSVIGRDFEKALRYKNRLLKEEAPQPLVDAINETFVACGAQLFCYRHALYRTMSGMVAEGYGDIARSGEELSIGYTPSWDHLKNREEGGESPCWLEEERLSDRNAVREAMHEAIALYSGQERARRRALVGPHNDKISFLVNGKEASQFASQGQQRSIVLAWKLAEVEMVRRTLGTEPVLLLDDVMSELDSYRRDMLVGNVTAETQTFITATDLTPFNEELLERARIVDLEKLAEGR